jgi:hypothetical protein
VLLTVGLVTLRRDGRRTLYRTNADGLQPCTSGAEPSRSTGAGSCPASRNTQSAAHLRIGSHRRMSC